MEIHFKDPNNRLANERRSKLLDPNSDLYKWLNTQHLNMSRLYRGKMAEKRMDFHIELIDEKEQATAEKLVERCKQLEGRKIDVTAVTIGKALVIKTPHVEGYGYTHITLAFFPCGIPLI